MSGSSTPTRNFSRPFPSPLTSSFDSALIQQNRALLFPIEMYEYSPNHPKPEGFSLRDKISTKAVWDFMRTSPSRHLNLISDTPRRSNFTEHVRGSSKTSFHSDTSTVTEISIDPGGASRPIIHFRPNLWRHLERDRDTLNLDLFWPVKFENEIDFVKDTPEDEDDEEDEDEESMVFPLNGLKQLCEFRRLRSLQLNGMMRSYQYYIWQTCWLNPELEDLTLEMALEPIQATHRSSSHTWTPIDHTWKMRTVKKSNETRSANYLGAHGRGVLHDEFGVGEYFDRQAVALAKLNVASATSITTPHLLPVSKLVLMGFVVDAGPFFHCFDPSQLRHIVFKDHCIDAGFTLPPAMQNSCMVSWAGSGSTIKVGPGIVQAVLLENGRQVSGSSSSSPWGSGFGLRTKLSTILPKRRSVSSSLSSEHV